LTKFREKISGDGTRGRRDYKGPKLPGGYEKSNPRIMLWAVDASIKKTKRFKGRMAVDKREIRSDDVKQGAAPKKNG